MEEMEETEEAEGAAVDAEAEVIRLHTPFAPYVAPRFPHMSEINSSF